MVVIFIKSTFHLKNAFFLLKTWVFSIIKLSSRFLFVFIRFIMAKHNYAVKISLKLRLHFEISSFFVRTGSPDELHISELLFVLSLTVGSCLFSVDTHTRIVCGDAAHTLFWPWTSLSRIQVATLELRRKQVNFDFFNKVRNFRTKTQFRVNNWRWTQWAHLKIHQTTPWSSFFTF